MVDVKNLNQSAATLTRRSRQVGHHPACAAFVLRLGVAPMSNFLVVDRASGRVRHEGKSLAECRGFQECGSRKRPSVIAIVVDCYARIEPTFVVQAVSVESGLVLCQSREMELDEAIDELMGAKLTLIPASMARKEGAA
jgi:hypothetical protein